MRRLRVMGSLFAVMVGAVLAVSVAATPLLAQTASAERELLVKADAARGFGPDSAKVVLIEFFDYSCSSCQQFHVEKSDSLKRALGPDVRMVNMGYLIPRFFRSFHAAEAALCAGALGGQTAYAAMSDRLFRRASEWSDARETTPIFAKYAAEAKVDAAAFADCTARDLMAPVILSDMSLSTNFEVGATPTFIVIPSGAAGPEDVQKLEGVSSVKQLTDAIATARAKAK
jgi:protein-disulfide isomerase